MKLFHLLHCPLGEALSCSSSRSSERSWMMLCPRTAGRQVHCAAVWQQKTPQTSVARVGQTRGRHRTIGVHSRSPVAVVARELGAQVAPLRQHCRRPRRGAVLQQRLLQTSVALVGQAHGQSRTTGAQSQRHAVVNVQAFGVLLVVVKQIQQRHQSQSWPHRYPPRLPQCRLLSLPCKRRPPWPFPPALPQCRLLPLPCKQSQWHQQMLPQSHQLQHSNLLSRARRLQRHQTRGFAAHSRQVIGIVASLVALGQAKAA